MPSTCSDQSNLQVITQGNSIDFSALERIYMIAEIGINHNGDLQIAKKLIDAANACSWHCVKFQKRTPSKVVPEAEKSKMRDTPWGRMTYIEYKERMEFGQKEYDYIDAYCKAKPINWSASVWDLESLAFLKQYNLPFYKIPSALLTSHDLIVATAQTGKPVLASTGMSTLEEIDAAVEILRAYSSQFVLMHCHSSYPAPLNELNLRVIPAFIKRYGCLVGYSGHEYGLDPTTVAVGLGATVIERHITLDHTMWGTDHSSSVEPQGMDKLNKQVLSVQKILGDGNKTVFESELPARKKLRGV